MKKTLLASFLLGTGLFHSTLAQSPWIVPAGSPVYRSLGAFEKHPYICSPQADVVWGIGIEGGRSSSSASYTWSIFHTADNGQTWQQRPPSSWSTRSTPVFSIEGTAVEDLSAVNDQTAWLLQTKYVNNTGTRELLRTSSGPAGFTPVTVPQDVYKIHFFTATTGIGFASYIAPGSTSLPIYRTTDGGITWAPIPNPPVFASPAEYLSVTDKQSHGSNLWISTTTDDQDMLGGLLLRTPDAGLTWTSTPDVGKVAFEDALNGLTTFYSRFGNTFRRHLRRTADGGITWTPVALSPLAMKTMTAVAGMPSTYLGYSFRYSGPTNLADGTISISYNRGASWQALNGTIVSGTFEQLVATTPGQIWASVNLADYSANQPMVMRYAGNALPVKQKRNTLLLTVYPNPTSGQVHLVGELPGPATVRVYDATGRLCQQTVISATQRLIDFSSQPSGLYQVVVATPNGQVSKLSLHKI